jgi:hypothetical protein
MNLRILNLTRDRGGHTDERTSDDLNLAISRSRAKVGASQKEADGRKRCPRRPAPLAETVTEATRKSHRGFPRRLPGVSPAHLLAVLLHA